jgi:hypothetical protein
MDWKREYHFLMAHFAQLKDNVVTQVIVVNNEEAPDEATGIAFCKSLFGESTEWVQTSYNGNIRKNFAGINFTYDSVRDVFISPKSNCHPDEVLNENTCRWECSNLEHASK